MGGPGLGQAGNVVGENVPQGLLRDGVVMGIVFDVGHKVAARLHLDAQTPVRWKKDTKAMGGFDYVSLTQRPTPVKLVGGKRTPKQ